MTDAVNHPPHYTQGAVECIDAIEAALGREGFIAFLRGQVIKYQWRLGHKGDAAEDAAKAHWYSQKLQSVYKARQLERKVAGADGFIPWKVGDDGPPDNAVVYLRWQSGKESSSKLPAVEWAWDDNVTGYRYP